MNWRAILTLVLLAAAILSGFSVWKQRVRDTPSAAATARSDYVLHDFELVALDSSGKEAFTLRAPELHRDPEDRTISMATPVFLFPDSTGAYWTTHSRNGWVSADSKEVRLLGDVRIDSPAGGATPARMTTARLNVYPDRKLATSPDAVTITRPGSILRGRGMEARLDTKQFTLRSDVTSRYVPQGR